MITMRPMATDNQNRPLPPNLYQRTGSTVYRYKGLSGYKTVKDADGSNAEYDLACRIAEAANTRRGQLAPSIKTIKYWSDQYIAWMEGQNKKLADKERWRYTRNDLNNFASEFSHININQLRLKDLREWWDKLSYDAQHNRRSAFSKFFQYCINSDVCSINPFSNSDFHPHLMKKPKPEKMRSPLELDQFFEMYESEHIEKYPHVKIAMAIALTTGMRQTDICLLTIKGNVIDNRLCKTIGKSEGQRGMTKASHHGYDLNKHDMLRAAINSARELSLKHKRCPFVLSYHPYRQQPQLDSKDHPCQVRPKKLSHDFATVRDLCKIKGIGDKKPPTFHEIKGLYILTSLKHYSDDQVQKAAAHMDKSTTMAYPANHAPSFEEVEVIITPSMLGKSL